MRLRLLGKVFTLLTAMRQPPPVLPAIIVFCRFSVPVPWKKIPPPPEGSAELPLRVQLTIVAWSSTAIAPPSTAELPLNVLLATTHGTPVGKIAPPLLLAELPTNVQPVTVRFP